MTSVLVDTNVFIDIFGPDNPFREWSARALSALRPDSQFIMTPVVWAELASVSPREETLVFLLSRLNLVREALPFSAAYRAGMAHAQYRRSGGLRERTLPDFFIGAHALVRSHRLLTRDSARYRSYFPDLDIISPQTHP
ncbi:DNA-binding protein [Rhizobium sp. J15]|uniref:type II toxin-antitoxin system VapC family toxin n=1 Tax=Rhizobium sp. J15 TaxID=2035450 RepID=UPI000BE87B73|nr:type II toxin-antitoxin system VapC family toxin [Rhizobium sp. J15]PDT16480.1 DNA-binding protein [Rhizobium sp. J15]